jgi:hypothetical protein
MERAILVFFIVLLSPTYIIKYIVRNTVIALCQMIDVFTLGNIRNV